MKSEVCETAVPTGLPAAFSFGEKSRRSCHVSRWSFVYPTAGLFQTSVRHDERNGTTKSGNPYHLPCTLPIASPAGIQPPYLFAARSAISVISTSESLKSAGSPFAKCAIRSCPDFAPASAAKRAGRSACGMRSIFTVTPFVSPHFFAQPSRYVSKSGTKWLHWRMLRLPESFGRAPMLAEAAAGDPLAPPPAPVFCCPTHAASTGAVAAAAAPFSKVRRLIRLVAWSPFFTEPPPASSESIPRGGAARNTISAVRKRFLSGRSPPGGAPRPWPPAPRADR